MASAIVFSLLVLGVVLMIVHTLFHEYDGP